MVALAQVSLPLNVRTAFVVSVVPDPTLKLPSISEMAVTVKLPPVSVKLSGALQAADRLIAGANRHRDAHLIDRDDVGTARHAVLAGGGVEPVAGNVPEAAARNGPCDRIQEGTVFKLLQPGPKVACRRVSERLELPLAGASQGGRAASSSHDREGDISGAPVKFLSCQSQSGAAVLHETSEVLKTSEARAGAEAAETEGIPTSIMVAVRRKCKQTGSASWLAVGLLLQQLGRAT